VLVVFPTPTPRAASLGRALVLSAALLLPGPARGADPARKLCVGACKEAAAACKEPSANVRDGSAAACAGDPATERDCLGVAKRVYKASKKACKGARKACKRCCKQLRDADACTVSPEIPVATGSFPAPDRGEIEALPLPPFQDGRGAVMIRLPDGDFGFDPEARTPVSAAAECATAILACYDETLRNVAGCFAAVPSCRGKKPWKTTGPMCCAAACGGRYQDLLREGQPAPVAFAAAIWEAPSCMPGLEGHPPEGAP
jgi:hypothetical protein